MKWTRGTRIQPWRHPERETWTTLVGEGDLGAIQALLRLTEPDVFRALGQVERPEGWELMRGEGAGWAMPAFTFSGPGRFNTPTFGCFYAARELETSVAETVHHHQRFLRDAAFPPSEVHMRVLRVDITAEDVVDLPGARVGFRARPGPVRRVPGPGGRGASGAARRHRRREADATGLVTFRGRPAIQATSRRPVRR